MQRIIIVLSLQVQVTENDKGAPALQHRLIFRPSIKDRLLKGKRDVVLVRDIDSKALDGSPAAVALRTGKRATVSVSETARVK
jgi:hypothetical protein